MFGVDLRCNDWKAHIILAITIIGLLTVICGFVCTYMAKSPQGKNRALYIILAGAGAAIIPMVINTFRKC